MKSRGPRIDPCGTPDSTGIMNLKFLHLQSLSVVYCKGSSLASLGYMSEGPYWLACLGELYGIPYQMLSSGQRRPCLPLHSAPKSGILNELLGILWYYCLIFGMEISMCQVFGC